MLHVYLFGGLQLRWEDDPLPPIRSRLARSLFAYLITHPDRSHTRDLLAGLFWPDMPDAQARRRLSQALWQIRQALKPLPSPQAYLLADAETVQFNREASYWLDVEAFEGNLREVRETESPPPGHVLSLVKEAVALYTGDFLAGYYDDWAVIERERLRDLYLEELNRLVLLCKAQGLYEEALTHASQLTRYDPLREEAHREVMRLCFLLGRPNEALQQYDLCCDLLAEELGAEPSSATTALYREISARMEQEATQRQPILATRLSPLLKGTGTVPFVGRHGERAVLVRAMEGALSGHGGIVLLEGEPGVGKTRLLQEISEDAAWRGLQVLWGRGHELGESTPYGALREVLERGLSPLRAGQLAELVEGVWLREVSQIVPQLAEWLPNLPPRVPLEPEDAQRRLLEAITQVLLALEQITPHLLILDDLQWADESTLGVIPHLLPRLQGRRMLVIVSFRGEEARARPAVWDTVRVLDRAGGHERVVLNRLSAAETAELVQRGLGLVSQAPHFEARLHRESGGNPLFVIETLRALHDERLLYQDETGAWRMRWDETTADYARLPLAPVLQQVIAGRLARLSPATRAILNAAAVLGNDFDFTLLHQVGEAESRGEASRIGGVEAEEPALRHFGWAQRRLASPLLSALEDLLRRGLLVEQKAAYRFGHDKIRQVAYEEIAVLARQRLHQKAGQALEAVRPEQVEALAHHFTRGQVWGKAVRYHRQAGEEAAGVCAFPTALEHYDLAIELAGRAGLGIAERFNLLGARERLLQTLGRREAQAEDLDRMAGLVGDDPGRLATTFSRRAWLYTETGRYDEAVRVAEQAMRLAEQHGDPAATIAALIPLGTALDRQGRHREAVPHLRDAVQIARQQGDRRQEAEARHLLATALSYLTGYDEARAELEATLAFCREIDDPLGQARSLGVLGILHMEQGNSQAAEDCYRRTLEICRTIGYRHGEGIHSVNLANLYYFQNRIGEALRLYDQAAQILHAIGERMGVSAVLANTSSVRLTLLGDDERAAQDAERALALCRDMGHRVGEAQCLSILGHIALYRGQFDMARDQVEASLELLTADPWLRAQTLGLLAVVENEAGHHERALALLDTAQEICHDSELVDILVGLLALRGEALLALDRHEEALKATERAMANLRSGTEQACMVPFRHARVLQAVGRTEEAREVFIQAYQMLMEGLEGLSASEWEMSLERVPEHRAIVEAWRAIQPHRVSFRLPRDDAPTGRPLCNDEWVEVTWTVVAPEDEAIPGKKARRRHRLLCLLREAGEQGAAPRVDDLAIALRVSPKTIKRDLAALRQAGHDVRTRGTRSS